VIQLLRRLWHLDGTVNRAAYALAGVGGFALKFAIDWSIARLIFNHTWTPLSYWRVVGLSGQGDAWGTPWMFLTLLIVSLPFLWFGMTMTLLRLRDAGLSAGWAALFFVPVLNVLLFITLLHFPSRVVTRKRDLSGVMDSALFAVVGTAALATIPIAVATRGLGFYGLGLFIAVPFCVGYFSAFLYRRRFPEARAQVYVVALLSTLLLAGFLMALAWEGAICLAMAAPLGIVVAMIGAWCGMQSARINRPPNTGTAYMTVAILPLLLIAEAAANRPAPLYRVDSEIIINAPPQTVWKNVVTFADIAGQPQWYFRAGIAYPLRARITGHGPGAIRTCEFTTGNFIEPIEVWDEPRLLRFRVTANPPPMRELSPYGFIDAPHLHGFLVSEHGQFLLRPLPDGRTRLIGTTWYQHHLWPAGYWRIWSDAIIHRIHMRVLGHIKGLSEGGIESRLKHLSRAFSPRVERAQNAG
jgi:uncharacterized membrane protein YhaH (DUF805 family)